MKAPILTLTIGELSGYHPAITQFFAATDGETAKPGRTFESWLAGLADQRLSDIGMDRRQVLAHVEALVHQVEALHAAGGPQVQSLGIVGGHDKSGRPEATGVTLKAGEVVCVVGPTGSGKSRLLADVECLAQGDTPSGRHVLINGGPPDPGWRFAANRKLIAQVSQNMNFVVDLSVAEFVAMHADCRMVERPGEVVERVIACANDLAGERFAADVSLTQLSGGQTRALMIADTALLSASPVVLIDEIENAGIDRKRALDLLIAEEKIVLISTHDPILALMGRRRLVIRNGAVAEVIDTSPAEKVNLARLEELDRRLSDLRDRLRRGERIDHLLDGRGPASWTL